MRLDERTADGKGSRNYVFTWVPDGWPPEELEKFVERFKAGGLTEEFWTCKAHKAIRPGDRVYLLKQRKPIGIFGRGSVVGEARRRADVEPGHGEWEVMLGFDARCGDVLCNPLVDAFLVKEQQLLRIPVPKSQWELPASGVSLREEAARIIDGLIASSASISALTSQEDVDDAVIEIADHVKSVHASAHGFVMSPRIRKAIEQYAMNLAKRHYECEGYSVEVIGKPYDLRCTSGKRGTLYVEVKGTQGDGLEVLLTPNEVAHARLRGNRMALFVVSGIAVSDHGTENPVASGGDVTIYQPWDIDSGELEPIGYCLTISKPTSVT